MNTFHPISEINVSYSTIYSFFLNFQRVHDKDSGFYIYEFCISFCIVIIVCATAFPIEAIFKKL